MALGSGLTAAVPVQGLAAAANAQRSKYIFAVAMVHARTDVSVEMLVESLGVRPSVARGFIAKMARTGVVSPPNAAGVARLAEPLQRIVTQSVTRGSAGGYVVKGPASSLRDKAVDFINEALDSDTVPPENVELSLSADDCAPPEVSDAARSAE